MGQAALNLNVKKLSLQPPPELTEKLPDWGLRIRKLSYLKLKNSYCFPPAL